MSKVHFTISLDPHNANEAAVLKHIHLLSSLVGDGEISLGELGSEIKHLLMGGYYLSRISPQLPERLAHHLVEPDLVEYLTGVLGVPDVAQQPLTISRALPPAQERAMGPVDQEGETEMKWTAEQSISVDDAVSSQEQEVFETEPDMALGNQTELSRIRSSGMFG